MSPRRRPLISVKEAGDEMGISESKAHQLAREGNLPGLVTLPGHQRVVRRAILEAWLRGEEVTPTRPALRAVG